MRNGLFVNHMDGWVGGNVWRAKADETLVYDQAAESNPKRHNLRI